VRKDIFAHEHVERTQLEEENREKTEVATMGSGEKSSVPKSEKLQNVRRQTHQRMKQQTAKKERRDEAEPKGRNDPSSISLKRLDALSRLAGAVVLLPPFRRQCGHQPVCRGLMDHVVRAGNAMQRALLTSE